MIAARRVVLAALLLACASCARVVGASSDGSVDADADLDATAICPSGEIPVYDTPGCDGTVAPVCVSGAPGDACAGIFCDCTGHTMFGGCVFSFKPFAQHGFCPDSGTP